MYYNDGKILHVYDLFLKQLLYFNYSTGKIENEQEGCDYLGFGPIFPTRTKPGLKPLGSKKLLDAYRKTHIPLFAIGGINSQTIGSILDTGAKRVAIVGAIMNADDPFKESNSLLEALRWI